MIKQHPPASQPDDFIERQGPAFLAHLLRRLADELVRGGSLWYPQMGVTAPPRTASTLLALDERGPLGVTQLASLLRQSHPLVIGWVRQLDALGLVEARSDPQDGRRSVIALTGDGRSEILRLRGALVVMEQASRQLMDEAAPEMFGALWRMERAVRRQPFIDRLQQQQAAAAEAQPPESVFPPKD
jgi:MarR family transcriptional regulator, organic hydroperoxide resistance regulator